MLGDNIPMIPAATLRQAERELTQCDPRLGQIIANHGPCRLGRHRRDPFHVLCTSIINQQLSTKAADTIQGRIAERLNAGDRFKPEHFRNVEPAALRAVGLSNAKGRWLVQIAGMVEAGEFSFRRLRHMDDESAIKTLDALPGIGRWSAEMFLMFALDRLDIFSMGDVGLRRGVERLHNGGEKMDIEATAAITGRWAPWRSVASWYLWRIGSTDEGAWA